MREARRRGESWKTLRREFLSLGLGRSGQLLFRVAAALRDRDLGLADSSGSCLAAAGL
jgi:hypothetical protein